MRRQSSSAVMANPVLVGAVTTLITVVAVFLAYNANNGLPFVPTRQLNFQVENGAALIPGNEVREGGYRIGVVDKMRALQLPGGEVGAHVTLKIDKKAGALPKDSIVTIRPRSVLGLKYVEIKRGRSNEMFRDGDTVPHEQSRLPVELHEFENIFDRRTRDAQRHNLRGFGNAFTERGVSINETIELAPHFLSVLQPVMSSLADPQTQLARFFKELGDAARTVAPVADRYAHGFTAGADTFEAWSRYPDRLRETIENAAPTMRVGVRSFRVQRPFLADYARLSRALRDASAEFPRTMPRLTSALRTGIPVLRRSPEINEKLRGTLGAARDLFRAPGTGIAFRGLIATVTTLNPTLRFVGPYITVCNYFNYAWTHTSEHISEPDPTGFSQRTLLNQAPRQKNSPGTIGATEPANGEDVQSGTPAHLHGNVYGAAVDRQGNADCESGQRGYIRRAFRNGPQRFNIVVDPHIPGNQGPTFTGRQRVLPGQTFSRAPEQGPAMPPELDP